MKIKLERTFGGIITLKLDCYDCPNVLFINPDFKEIHRAAATNPGYNLKLDGFGGIIKEKR